MAITMMQLAKEFENRKPMQSGHKLCPGCGAPLVARWALMVAEHLGYKPVIGFATGCMEVSSSTYPYSSWNVPYIHNAFENSAATVSGVETAYRSLLKRGKIKDQNQVFFAFGGDGGTYDIGFQSLSGAVERGHNFVYILYDNEGYMNTGNQRSGSTPPSSMTTTAPVGSASVGKVQFKKNLTEAIAAHGRVYVAQASVANPMDYFKKVEKAIKFDGPAFINVFSPCVRFWRVDPSQTRVISQLALDTHYWPLYEVDRGIYKINYKPRNVKPVLDFMKAQGRFKNILKSKNADEVVGKIQKEVDRRWNRLIRLEEATKDNPEEIMFDFGN